MTGALDDAANNKRKAWGEAANLAAKQLANVDLRERCAKLGVKPPQAGRGVRLRLLGREIELTPPDFSATVVDGAPLHPVERLLALHYLLCEYSAEPMGAWVTFRDFPGGQFYWNPYRSRTALPLLQAFGNDLDRLQQALDRFEWEPLALGDFSARVQLIGRLSLSLVYHRGDDEFPPEVDILFDAALRRIYGAEDIAAAASRVCLPLCAQACQPCGGCGLCDRGDEPFF